jgi:hypothetical protein
MRVILSALTLGFIGAMSVTAPEQARAQEAYIYGPGVSIEIGPRPYGYRHHYHRHHYWRYRYHDEPYAAYYYAPSYGYYGYYGYYGSRQRCEPGYTWRNGACRP